MMRSLFSGVAGLRTHQTRMDVIGNNIANVNTVAYKSNQVTFQDLLYQTTQNASGSNAATGRAGINAKQIGLGVATGAISTDISTSGSAQSTGSPFDIRITGDSFFIVSDGGNVYYTRAGSFNVDANGTLAMSTNGYPVMGYGTTKDASGDIVINTAALTSLDIMSDANMVSEPIATTKAYGTGILDKNSDALSTTQGQVFSVPFYDNLGYSYTAQFKIEKQNGATGDDNGQYKFTMTDIVDSNGDSIFKYTAADVAASGGSLTTADIGKEYKTSAEKEAKLAAANVFTTGSNVAYLTFDTFMTPTTTTPTGELRSVTAAAATAYVANVATNTVNGSTVTGLGLNFSELSGFATGFAGMNNTQNSAVSLDLSQIQNIDNKGSSTVNGKRGSVDSDAGAGCGVGEMSSVSIGQDGKIVGSYTNGQTKLLGQIATATFANASGLEKEGDNLYAATLNSGEAVVNDITAGGGSMSTGELEMSNVDLSSEFTNMITTQRGFQANSRIITVSDSMIEELVNLKR